MSKPVLQGSKIAPPKKVFIGDYDWFKAICFLLMAIGIVALIIVFCSSKKEVKLQELAYTQRDWISVRIIFDHDTLTVANYYGSENYILSNGLSADRKIIEENG